MVEENIENECKLFRKVGVFHHIVDARRLPRCANKGTGCSRAKKHERAASCCCQSEYRKGFWLVHGHLAKLNSRNRSLGSQSESEKNKSIQPIFSAGHGLRHDREARQNAKVEFSPAMSSTSTAAQQDARRVFLYF